MKNFSQPSDPAADEQAAHWAARLEGGVLNAADRVALDAWLNEREDHRALLSDYCQFSADLEQQLPALVRTGAVKMPIEQKKAPRSWSLPWMLAGTLATVALVAIGTWSVRTTLPAEN